MNSPCTPDLRLLQEIEINGEPRLGVRDDSMVGVTPFVVVGA